jgi:adenylate cyclase
MPDHPAAELVAAPESAAASPVWSVIPTVTWLAREGRFHQDLASFIAELSEHLVAHGAPLWRIYIGLMTIHPQLRAMAVTWRRDQGVSEEGRRHGIEGTPAYIGSPVQAARENPGHLVRYRLEPVPPSAHDALKDIAAAGATDYICIAVRLSRGQSPVIALATDRQGGFNEGDIVNFQRLLDHVAPLIESQISWRVADTVAETYLGKMITQRVLDGHIRRGDGQVINAVLWFSDMRNYTRMSEDLPPDRMLVMLNDYFEVIGAALKRQGGEILKFIGDGVMAIFPIADAMFIPSACAGALDAARETLQRMAEINVGRLASGEPEIRFGVGLHIGPVTFGNIGTEDRLDFTVIGAAVNRCARLEALTKVLGAPVLMSAEFNDMCPRPLRSLGNHRLRGVKRAVEVFTLP